MRRGCRGGAHDLRRRREGGRPDLGVVVVNHRLARARPRRPPGPQHEEHIRGHAEGRVEDLGRAHDHRPGESEVRWQRGGGAAGDPSGGRLHRGAGRRPGDDLQLPHRGPQQGGRAPPRRGGPRRRHAPRQVHRRRRRRHGHVGHPGDLRFRHTHGERAHRHRAVRHRQRLRQCHGVGRVGAAEGLPQGARRLLGSAEIRRGVAAGGEQSIRHLADLSADEELRQGGLRVYPGREEAMY
mmetsp:Transcript_68667/g.210564  ORF Transcript_68667/g.210564 Transcript_68667/m.210564 type:complete len:239 (+) Transcript_68667:228-944(+)